MSLGLGRVVPSVLLVEDDAPTRVFLAENLIADRFAPVSATSGEEAMAMLAGSRPDVAMVDVGLPGMSGLDLMATIRDGGADDPWDAGMPILLISGRGEPSRRGARHRAGGRRLRREALPLSRGRGAARRAHPALARRHVRRGDPGRRPHGRPPRAEGDPGRPAPRPLGQGVRAPRRPGQGSRPRAHQGRAAPRRLGLPRRRADAHGRQPRQPAAPQARGHGGGERWVVNIWGVGYRLLPEEA